MPPLVFAVEIGNIVATVVLVISVLSWLINVIQGNTPDGNARAKRPQRPPQAKPSQGVSEIEDMLKELAGSKKNPPQEKRPQQPPVRQVPPGVQTRSKPNPSPRRPVAARPSPPPRLVPPVQEVMLTTSTPGAALRTHHLATPPEANVTKETAEKVSHDLGNRIAAAKPPQEAQVHPLVKVLRDPNGIRQALLLNEILQPPRGRRG